MSSRGAPGDGWRIARALHPLAGLSTGTILKIPDEHIGPPERSGSGACGSVSHRRPVDGLNGPSSRAHASDTGSRTARSAP